MLVEGMNETISLINRLRRLCFNWHVASVKIGFMQSDRFRSSRSQAAEMKESLHRIWPTKEHRHHLTGAVTTIQLVGVVHEKISIFVGSISHFFKKSANPRYINIKSLQFINVCQNKHILGQDSVCSHKLSPLIYILRTCSP